MNSPHVIILNRSTIQSAAGWIHIVPKGELPNAEAGIVQVLDEASMDSIMANIAECKNRLGDNWPGIYAGREHFIYDSDQDSAALAWFKDFEKRADGIWANDDGLTPSGATAIRNQDYKFTSFVVANKDLKRISDTSADGFPRYRVLAIETVGFTNQANGKDLLTPITNRGVVQPGTAVGDHKAADVFSTPDLDRWLTVVNDMSGKARNVGHIAIDYNTAWNWAKKQFPELYTAAFGDGKADGLDEQSAGKNVGMIANRISASSRKGFDFSWNFVRDNLPHIFNRMSYSSGVVLNRQPEKPAPEQVQNKAATLILRLARLEQVTCGTRFDYAWQRVQNRHPALMQMADGRITQDEACAQEPELRGQL